MLRAPVWGKWVTGEDGERAVYPLVAQHNADVVWRLDDRFLDDTIISNHELETTSDVTLYRTDNTRDFFEFEAGDTITTNHHLFTVSENEPWSYEGKPWDLKLLVPSGVRGLFLSSAMRMQRSARVREVIVGPGAQWIVKDTNDENVTLQMKRSGGLLVYDPGDFTVAGGATASPLPRITQQLSLISSLKF
jgi:hypothetical protein